MERSWLVDSRGFAKKVKGGTLPSAKQLKDCGAKRECPNCHCLIDNRDTASAIPSFQADDEYLSVVVSHEWPGLPIGVKFDPSDIEILEHLAAKCGVGNSEPHMFIDEFIPTLGAEGICYKHPEELPGSRKDGSSVHFFHRTINAYTTGQRKRRKIHSEPSSTKEKVRWHKTGKTKAVIENGIQKGCKKIMVLYGASVKGSKPEKANWVMHQYHLGNDEDEKEGQYVVSKIFYQAQKVEKNDKHIVIEEPDVGIIQASPMTPKTNTPNPPRPGKFGSFGDVTDDCALQSPAQESEFIKETSHPPSSHTEIKDETEYPSWLAGESQATGLNGIDDVLFCDEILDSHVPLGDSRQYNGHSVGSSEYTNLGTTCGFSDLENLELDTPPDFNLSDLQFYSQDSMFGW